MRTTQDDRAPTLTVHRTLPGMNEARVAEILSWYAHENLGVRTNLARLLMHGRLSGSGKLVILPVDQGFEDGPARSFAMNPAAYDPRYHLDLAYEAGCSGFAASRAFLQAGISNPAHLMPTIMKINSSDSLVSLPDPIPSMTSEVKAAAALGCVAVGFTIYPGSTARNTMYQQLAEVAAAATDLGLVVVVWSYPRGSGLSDEGETAVDVVAYAAQIASQMGAHIIKVKPPTAHIEFDANRSALANAGTATTTLAQRVAHVVQSAFDGRRIVIFSGGAAKDRESVLDENLQTAAGGGFGTIMGRNTFQRPRMEALRLLHDVMQIHAGTTRGADHLS